MGTIGIGPTIRPPAVAVVLHIERVSEFMRQNVASAVATVVASIDQRAGQVGAGLRCVRETTESDARTLNGDACDRVEQRNANKTMLASIHLITINTQSICLSLMFQTHHKPVNSDT